MSKVMQSYSKDLVLWQSSISGKVVLHTPEAMCLGFWVYFPKPRTAPYLTLCLQFFFVFIGLVSVCIPECSYRQIMDIVHIHFTYKINKPNLILVSVRCILFVSPRPIGTDGFKLSDSLKPPVPLLVGMLPAPGCYLWPSQVTPYQSP